MTLFKVAMRRLADGCLVRCSPPTPPCFEQVSNYYSGLSKDSLFCRNQVAQEQQACVHLSQGKSGANHGTRTAAKENDPRAGKSSPADDDV
jgi:hypothetical protein